MNWFVSAIFVWLGLEDLRKKAISLRGLTIAVVAAGLYGVWQNDLLYSTLGAIPGIVLFLLALLQPEAVGKGDGILVSGYGMLYGWRSATLLLMCSFLLAAVVGLFVNILSRKRKVQLPFIPFMGMVHIGMML